MIQHQKTLRLSVAALAPNTQFVRCEEDRLEAYLAEVARRDEQPIYDPTLTNVGSVETRLAFVLLRDATNFGSGWHPYLTKLPGLSGARTTGNLLAQHLASFGAPSADWLCGVRPEDCASIFRQSMTSPVDELMSLFATAWRQLGEVLRDEYAGRYDGLVAAARGSAVALTDILSRIGYFADFYEYKGLAFPFLKRAQLTCYDLSLACADNERCCFSDLAQLTIFADNLVPHVLKVDGVLTFDADLETRIESGAVLEAGSAEEIEIRAMAVYAAERLSALAAARGDFVMPLRLSDWLWNRGQSPQYKARPRPRIRTVHY
jgi:hypothetical protein